MLRVAIIGGGWAGLAAAVQATADGHRVTLLEASRQLGGRARSLPPRPDEPETPPLDNGQHVLLGANQMALNLMRQVGIDPETALLRLPLQLRGPGHALHFGSGAGPWDGLWAVLAARGWGLGDKLNLLAAARRWQSQDFQCSPSASVYGLCAQLPAAWVERVVRPLCLAALNTPIERASAQVFLQVLRDVFWGARGSSDLLIPRTDLEQLLPRAARDWLQARGTRIATGRRVRQLRRGMADWQVDGEAFDHVVLACPVPEAARLVTAALEGIGPNLQQRLRHWLATAARLEHQAVATVYLHSPTALSAPWQMLHEAPGQPAQWVFDRGQCGGREGLLAFVVCASRSSREQLTQQVLAQAREQLGLDGLVPVQTVVDKRATFACTAGLTRPAATIARGLTAAGDYVAGPYPATLEGAVRSGLMAALGIEGIEPVRPPAPATVAAPDAPDSFAATPASRDGAPTDPPPAGSS